MNNNEKFWGKYQGTVIQNVDPLRKGRLQVEVPDVVSFIPTTWAQPCLVLAGPTGPPMGVFMIPPIGAGVWVEFEHGNPNKPVWVGCRWGAQSDIPLVAQSGNPLDPNIVIQSLLQHAIVISDLPPAVPPPIMPPTPAVGGITLRSSTGASIVVNDAGIFISNGKGATMMMVGKQIDFNMGALTIIS